MFQNIKSQSKYKKMIVSKIKYFRGDKEITLTKTNKGIKMNIELNEEKNTFTVDTLLNNFVRNIHAREVKYFSLVIDNAYFIGNRNKEYINRSDEEMFESTEYKNLQAGIKTELKELINLVKKNPEIF